MDCGIRKLFRRLLNIVSRKKKHLSAESVRRIVVRVVDHGLDSGYVAKQFKITRRRVQQIAKEYRDTGSVPEPERPGRKPGDPLPDLVRDLIKRAWLKLHVCASGIGHWLRRKQEVHIGNDRINKVLIEEGFILDDPARQGKRKKWIRYERSRSLSAIHIDWAFNKEGRWVCLIEDDSSRKLLAIGEFPERSTDHVIELLEPIIREFEGIRKIGQVITDHGAEFCASKRDANGDSKHKFEKFLETEGIEHVLTKYNHPQSNGKLERLVQTYKQHRFRYESPAEFQLWYNCVRPHRSLDYENLETPEKAFWTRLQGFLVGSFWTRVERELIA